MITVSEEAEIVTRSVVVVRPFYYPGGTLNAVDAQIDNVPIAEALALECIGRVTILPPA